MLAMLGLYVQALVTGKGPVSNWLEHLADPSSANGFAFATKFAPTLLASDASPLRNPPSEAPNVLPRRRRGTRAITEVPPHWRVALLGRSIRRSPPSPDVDVQMPDATTGEPRRTSTGGKTTSPRPPGPLASHLSLEIWRPGRRAGRYETPFEAPLEAQRPSTSPKVAERRGTMPARTPSNFLEKR